MISGNLEHIKALVYSNWSDSPVFNALLISLIDSAKLFTFSESQLVILLIAFATSIQMLSSLTVSSLFIFKEFYRSRPYLISCHIIVRAGYDIKLSIPLNSARALSSEGLVLRHRRECANLPQRFAVSAADSHRLARPAAQRACALCEL